MHKFINIYAKIPGRRKSMYLWGLDFISLSSSSNIGSLPRISLSMDSKEDSIESLIESTCRTCEASNNSWSCPVFDWLKNLGIIIKAIISPAIRLSFSWSSAPSWTKKMSSFFFRIYMHPCQFFKERIDIWACEPKNFDTRPITARPR